MAFSGKIIVGTSGWQYDHWKERFYPKEVSDDEFLAFYAKDFGTVEINNTFYQQPDEDTVKNWVKQVPQDFVFSIKANRYITHQKNLKISRKSVEKLTDLTNLFKNKLGAILFQLSGNWHVNEDRLDSFVKLLPSDRRYAFEFRHESWFTDEVYEILISRGIALVIHDMTGKPTPEELTAEFLYVRFHGSKGGYRGKYSNEELQEWAERIKTWKSKKKDVYAYFNNDAEANAVANAKELKNLVKR